MNSTVFESFPVDADITAQDHGNNRLTSKVTHYLRWTGSILIILSAATFMLQGYQDMLPAYRYWVALAFTLLLCAGGLACAYLFKETKGTRVLFGLATAFLPVQVSQVSAMIYAYINGHNAMQPEYSWLQFMEVSPAIIAIDLALTAILLMLVSYAGFSILVRKHLYTLLLVSTIGNSLLLLPIRDSSFIAIILGCLLFGLTLTERRLHPITLMKLPEGMAARAIIWIPAIIMLGRSLLHPTSFLLSCVVLTFVTVFTIYDIKRYTKTGWIIYLNQCIGTITALAIWFIIANQFPDISGNTPLKLFLPLALLLFVLSEHITYQAKYYRVAGAVVAIFITFNAMLEQLYLAPVISIATGILLSIAGLKYREKAPFFIGNICFIGGLLFYSQYLVDFYATTPWLSSICLGLFTILLASYLEKREMQIINKSRYFYKEVTSWQ